LSVAVDPFAATRLPPLDFAHHISDTNSRQVVFVAELWQNEQWVARCVAPFVPSKHLSLRDPQLAAKAYTDGEQFTVEVTAQALARFVEVALEGADVIFSDNYFDVPAGRTQVVTSHAPAGWTLEQVGAALRLRSLFDSYS
jgi:beta-mannosidase